MGLREIIKPRMQDWAMSFMNDLRPETITEAKGEVLEVGFGTGLNLRLYGQGVKSVTGLDPMTTEGFEAVERRIERVGFPVERTVLRADGQLPFDAGRFDTVVTTWTLCSIPDPHAALLEMHRVLRPGGRYLFIEHGRSDEAGTAKWQDRLNPIWRKFADGCNINRKMDDVVARGGFELDSLERFRGRGPSVLASMYRGIAIRS
jgi:SAM-dependent methyltransferase